MRRPGILLALAGAAIAAACAQPMAPAAIEPPVTPLPRAAPADPPAARPTPRPTPTAAPTPAPSPSPTLAPSPTPTPFAPSAWLALDVRFRRDGVATAHAIVTAEWDGARDAQAGTTDGAGLARLRLPVLPLPATYRLEVGGRPAGTLFLLAGARPRVNPAAGWAVEPGLATEPL